MRARGPKSYPALAGARRCSGSGLWVLALLFAAPAVDACGGDVTGSGTSTVTGRTGGIGPAASGGGGANGHSGGSFTSGGASESGGTASGGIATGGVWTVTGGAPSGGTATGGSATGGTAAHYLCDTVASLPTTGTSCNTFLESQCDATGNQCVCERGIWICSTTCASTYPEPAPNSPCVRGTACNYPSGVSCYCLNSSWHCLGSSACPVNMPGTGPACDGLTGTWCDYPNSNPGLHFVCYCSPNIDAGSTWNCFQSAPCPATQPAYDLKGSCPGLAFCSYGSTHCTCSNAGNPWVCGLWVLGIFSGDPPEPGG